MWSYIFVKFAKVRFYKNLQLVKLSLSSLTSYLLAWLRIFLRCSKTSYIENTDEFIKYIYGTRKYFVLE